MSINLKQYEVWFVTGSQHLYGPETLKKVAEHSQEIAKALNIAPAIPVKVVFKPVLVTPDLVTELCQAASSSSANPSRICTRNITATFRGRRLTWIS